MQKINKTVNYNVYTFIWLHYRLHNRQMFKTKKQALRPNVVFSCGLKELNQGRKFGRVRGEAHM